MAAKERREAQKACTVTIMPPTLKRQQLPLLELEAWIGSLPIRGAVATIPSSCEK
jgi:hypothetical protein